MGHKVVLCRFTAASDASAGHFCWDGFHSLDQICDCVVNSARDCADVSCASTDADVNLEYLPSVHRDDVCGDTV